MFFMFDSLRAEISLISLYVYQNDLHPPPKLGWNGEKTSEVVFGYFSFILLLYDLSNKIKINK